MFHFLFVHYTFSSVWVAEWPPFGKYLPSRSVICSHCILSVCDIYLFPVYGFKSGICLLIAPVPVHCFSIPLIREVKTVKRPNLSTLVAALTSSTIWLK